MVEQGRKAKRRTAAGQGGGRLISRNVTVDGHRTSLRLEPETWAALDEICQLEETNVHALCSLIERHRRGTSRTSAVRVFIVSYFRAAARGVGRPPAGVVADMLPEIAAFRRQHASRT